MALRTTGPFAAGQPTAGQPTARQPAVRTLAAGLPAIRLFAAGLLAAGVLATALAGCGSASGIAKAIQPGSSAAERKLERADLAIVGHGLRGAEASIRREVAASKAAWPVVVHGLPSQLTPTERRAISTATRRAQGIATPRFISYAGELTGAAAAVAGLLLSYEGLSQRGWTFTTTAAAAVGSATESSLEGSSAGGPGGPSSAGAPSAGGPNAEGPRAAGGLSPAVRTQLANASPSAVRFLRANANLYIGCVYDGHYNLSVIGEDLLNAYRRLGGATAFGAALRPAEVESLVRFYSPAAARLAPKPPASPTGS
jgi:hypothetical protein